METRSLQNLEQLTGMIAVLEHEDSIKKDYVANSKNNLHFLDGKLILTRDNNVTYEPTPFFHSQVSEKMQIPKPYYDRMLTSAKHLLDTNVNHWLDKNSKNFLIRTFEDAAQDYKARAFLSDRYSIIDNYQVLMEALEAIRQTGVNIEIVNAELSDTRMYLKVVCPEVEIFANDLLKFYRFDNNTGVGTGVISGFTLQNSEIGAGSFMISPRGLVKGCLNGMIYTTDSLKNIHLGAQMDELEFHKNKDVMNANIKLIREQIKHAVKTFLSKEYLQKLVNVYTTLGTKQIEAPVEKVIEVVAKTYAITEERKANLLKYFIKGGDTSRMGVASAMTRECQDLKDADLKHETEVASFEVLKSFDQIEAAAFRIKRSSN